MKKGKRLLILLAAAVLFGAGALLLNLNTRQQEAAKKAAEETPKPVLMTVDADHTSTLSYTRGGETIDFARQDGAWVYAPRKAFALDTAKVKTMLDSVKRVEAVRGVTDTNDNLADYGLAKPAVSITATGEDGAAQTLLLGDKNTPTGNYYAAIAGKDGVYTVSSDVFNAFDQNLMGLLTAENYPAVDAEAVTGVTLDGEGGSTALEYHPGGDASAYSSAFQWFARDAGGALTPVNPDAMDAYLKAATAVTYAGTVADTKADLAKYGLDAPKTTLSLQYTDYVPLSQAADVAMQEAIATPKPTQTPAPTGFAAPTTTAAPAATATATATAKPTATATATVKPTATATATATAKPAATATPTATAKPTATATATTKPTATATATATAKPTATATATATTKPTATATAKPTATPAARPTPTATLSGRAGAAIAEGADAVPSASEEPTATPTATPEPTVPVTRMLTLLFGGTDADGNVYMTHNKTDRIFTVSAETYRTLVALSMDSLKMNRPAYLSLSDITGMTASMGDVSKTVTAEAVTATDKDGAQTVKTVYRIDGKDIKTSAFSLLIGHLKTIKAEQYTDQPVATNEAPVFRATFTQSRAGFETFSVAFYPYDANFMQAEVNGDASMLVNKKDVASLQTYLDGLVAVEPTATPSDTAAPATTAAP